MQADTLDACLIAMLKCSFRQMRPWLRRRRVRQLPRYLVLGPPASGKSCWIKAVGGPLLQRTDAGVVSWSLHETGLWLEVGSALCQTGWTLLLGQLCKSRWHRPINGVVLVLPVRMLLETAGEALRSALARLRHTLLQIRQRCGAGVPIYLQINHVDRLSGFAALFADTAPAIRQQMFGLHLGDAAVDITTFRQRFSRLCQRLHQLVFDRLNQLPDPVARAAALGFPGQIARAGGGLELLLGHLSGASSGHADLLICGLYFSSCGQSGPSHAIRQSALAVSLARTATPLPALGGQQDYFVSDWIGQVLLPDCRLAPAVRWLTPRWYVWLAVALLLILLPGGWMMCRYQQAQQQLQAEQQAAAALTQLVLQGFSADRPASLLPLLSAVPRLAANPARHWPVLGWHETAEGLQTIRPHLYQQLLQATIPVWILQRLHRVLDDPGLTDAQRYQTLRLYLMLGNRAWLDQQAMLNWFRQDVAQTVNKPAEQAELLTHLAAWLARPAPDVALDQPLVAQARSLLQSRPLAPMLFDQLQGALQQQMPGQLSLLQMAGPAAGQVWWRRRGQLREGVPYPYTLTGFHAWQDLRDQLFARPEQIARVLGIQQSPAALQAGKAAVDALYFAASHRAWLLFLQDVEIRQSPLLTDGTAFLRQLAAEDGPLVQLLQSIDRQTRWLSTNLPDSAVGGLPALLDTPAPGKSSRLTRLLAQLNQAADYLEAVRSARANNLPATDGKVLNQLRQTLEGLDPLSGLLLRPLLPWGRSCVPGPCSRIDGRPVIARPAV